jgi:hypothetical protein
MSKEDEIVHGKMTNLESGEEWNVQFKFHLNDAELHAIVKVEDAEIMTSSEDPDQKQVVVNCKALDAIGLVYGLSLDFSSGTNEEMEKINADMQKDAIFLVKGRYSILGEDIIAILLDPTYLTLPPGFDDQELREVFRVNSDPLARMQ